MVIPTLNNVHRQQTSKLVYLPRCRLKSEESGPTVVIIIIIMVIVDE